MLKHSLRSLLLLNSLQENVILQKLGPLFLTPRRGFFRCQQYFSVSKIAFLQQTLLLSLPSPFQLIINSI